MKLRQKLAAVLAASMILTAVPVVTFADSSSRVTKTVTVAEGFKQSTEADAPELVINLKDGFTTGSAIYLQLEGATWLDEIKDGTVEAKGGPADSTYTFKTTKINSKEVELKYVGEKDLTVESLYFPLLVQYTGGEASVKIDGNNTTVKSEKVVFGNAVTSQVGVTVGEATTILDDGQIADIYIEEATPGAFANAANKKIEITLENSEFKFVKLGSTLSDYLKPSKGLTTIDGAKVEVDSRDPQTLIVTLPTDTTKTNGKLTLTGIKVESTVRTPQEGVIEVYMNGGVIENKTVKVANVTESDVTVTINEKDVKAIKTGQTGVAKFNINETRADGFNHSRTIDFTLTNGYIDAFDEDKFDADHAADKNLTVAAKVAKFEDEVKAKLQSANSDLTIDDVELNKKDQVIGFSARVKDSVTKTVPVTFNYSTTLDQAGDVAVKVESRMFNKDYEIVVGKSSIPFTVKTETAKLAAGKKDQVGGKVVIEEAEKRMLASGDIVIALEDTDYLSFGSKIPQVKVTKGDLVLGDVTIDRDGNVVVEVVRTSREASTIEIEGFNVNVKGYTPVGDYSAYVTVGDFKLEQREFVEIVDESVLDGSDQIAANGLKKGAAAFTIGSQNYTVNAEAKVMDATPYVSEKGRTMLPLRFVSEAFGLGENEILFSQGTVTIFAGNRTLQLQNGSNIATLNGVQIAMEEAVVIKEQRTYVPVGEVGRLLGIQVDWDQATQTATFTNK